MSSGPADGTIAIVASSSRTGPLFGLMVLALMVGTVACTTSTAGSPTVPVVERRGPTGAVPTGLDRFYAQPLTWGDCKAYARSDVDRKEISDRAFQCTRLTVPL